MIASKVCIKCGIEKPLDVFQKRKRDKDGRTNTCHQCANEYNRVWSKVHRTPEQTRKSTQKWKENHPEAFKASMKKYRKNNLETLKNRYKKWRLENIEIARSATRTWYKNNPGKSKEYGKKRRSNPKNKLSLNVSTAICNSLKGNKNGWHWETLVGYTLEDLKKHLEKRFREGMTWGNYGQWHIDHKIPISAFNFDKPEHLDFKRCWDLKNLQPLWAEENIRKKDKLDKPFQPSLPI